MIRFTPLLLIAAAAVAGPERTQEHLERLVERVRVSAADFDFSKPEDQEAFKKADVDAAEASHELLSLLSRNPEAWDAARPALRKLPEGAAKRDVKLRLIDLLAHDADAASVKLLDAELARDGRGFSTRTIIRMDRHGSKAAAAALGKLVAEKPSFRNLEAAIHLGLAGNKSARPVLDWAVSSGAGTREFNAFSYGAALACRRLGDEKPWQAIRRRAGEEIARALEADDFATARWYALQLEYYCQVARRADRPDLLAFDAACATHVTKRTPAVETVADLHELLRDCSG